MADGTHQFARGAMLAGKRIEHWKAANRIDDTALAKPLHWTKPRYVILSGDLFAEAVPDEWIDRVVAVMALAPQHVFQLLTKRAERMRAYMTRGQSAEKRISSIASGPLIRWPLPNCWLGVSVEDQARADERIPDLLATPAAVRFISAEPLIGRIMFDQRWFGAGDPEDPRTTGLDWVIVGGESGPNARPMHPDQARSLRDQCAAAGVPFFFKQWGEWLPGENLGPHRNPSWPLARWQDGNEGRHPSPDHIEWRHFTTPGMYGAFTIRVGKRAAGRLLDGRAHEEMPR